MQTIHKYSAIRQLMYEVFYSIPSVKWTDKLSVESGFYGRVKKRKYFFGMNHESLMSGSPVCLSYRLDDKEGLEKYYLLDNFIKVNHEKELTLASINGNIIVQFTQEYFKKERSVMEVKKLIGSLCDLVI